MRGGAGGVAEVDSSDSVAADSGGVSGWVAEDDVGDVEAAAESVAATHPDEVGTVGGVGEFDSVEGLGGE